MRKTMIAVFALTLAFGTRASAETITAGTLSMDAGGFGALTLVGDGGFQFEGSVYAWDGIYRAVRLDPSTSAPGMDIDLSGFWTGTAVNGLASYDGAESPVGGLRDAWAELRIGASAAAPAGSGDVTLTVPFALHALFYLGAAEPLRLDGYGMAEVLLSAFGGDSMTPAYSDLRRVDYRFAPLTPVSENPEPGTLLLAATGLAALWRLRRARAV